MPLSQQAVKFVNDPLQEQIRAFPAIRLEVTACAESSIQLPAFKGSTLRGGLGHCLKRLVCVRNPPDSDLLALYDPVEKVVYIRAERGEEPSLEESEKTQEEK